MARNGAPPPRRYRRTDRLNEVLREVVADELERVGDDVDARLRLVTITGVRCAPDLIEAKIFFSTLQDPTEVAAALEGQRHRLQRAVAGQLRVRRTPVLSFRHDPGVVTGRRVDELLRAHPARKDEVPVDPAAYKEPRRRSFDDEDEAEVDEPDLGDVGDELDGLDGLDGGRHEVGDLQDLDAAAHDEDRGDRGHGG